MWLLQKATHIQQRAEARDVLRARACGTEQKQVLTTKYYIQPISNSLGMVL